MGAAETVIVRHSLVRRGCAEDYAHCRAELTAALSGHPGFVRVEVEPPSAAQDEWVTTEHFTDTAAAIAWLDSPERLRLARLADGFVDRTNASIIVSKATTGRDHVTAVISNRVLPGHDLPFREWMRQIQAAQARFPGYLGVDVQPPVPGVSDDWITLLRFDTAEHLRAWLDSDECRRLTEQSEPLSAHADYHLAKTSFVNLLAAQERAADPPVWKVNAVVLLTLYPVVVLTLLLLNPLLTRASTALELAAGLAFAITVFIGNVIGVAATGFCLVPWAARLLDGWLAAKDPRRSMLGTVAMVGGYAALIAVMSAVAACLL